TANGRTALVQGASSLSGLQRREFLRTALVVIAAANLFILVAMPLMASRIAGYAGLPRSSAPLMTAVAGAAGATSGFVFLSAILNALREIGRLAWLQLAAPAAAAILAWPVAAAVEAGHPRALAQLIWVPAVSSLLAAGLMISPLRARIKDWFAG